MQPQRVPELLFADMPFGTCSPGAKTCHITKGLAALKTLPVHCQDNTCAIATKDAALWCDRVPAPGTGLISNCPRESQARQQQTPTFMCSTPGGGVAFFSPRQGTQNGAN